VLSGSYLQSKKSVLLSTDFFAKTQLFSSNNFNTFLVACNALKLNCAIDKSEECVIFADANACAGMYVSASLANDDVACDYAFAVIFLNAESLRVTVAAVLCRTNTFFVSKKL